MSTLTNLMKAGGGMKAQDFYADSTLKPEDSRKVINQIVDQSSFLKLISTDKTRKLTKSFDTWDLAHGILVRVQAGSAPKDSQKQKMSVGSVLLENKPVQLYAKITQDTLEDNADNPNFENEIFASFSRAFSNDLLNLGLNGVKDDYENNKFENLNKGWITLAKENAKSVKLKHKATDTLFSVLTNMIKGSADIIKHNGAFLVSHKNFIEYQLSLGKQNGGLPYLINAQAGQFMGLPIISVDFMPDDVIMLTPLKNLIMSMGLDIRRTRWYDHEESSLKYKFELYSDYQIAVGAWVSISTQES